MKTGFIAAALFLIATSVSAQANPLLDKWLPPKPTNGFVVDSAHVLSPEAITVANRSLKDLYDTKKAPSVIVTLPTIKDYQPYEVAAGIGRKWGVVTGGQPGDQLRNFGMVLLIVPKETSPDGRGKCFLAPSRAMEGTVTDAAAGNFCRQLIPQFKLKDYSGAATVAATEINKMVVAGIAEVSQKQSDARAEALKPHYHYVANWPMIELIVFLLALVGFFAWVYNLFGKVGDLKADNANLTNQNATLLKTLNTEVINRNASELRFKARITAEQDKYSDFEDAARKAGVIAAIVAAATLIRQEKEKAAREEAEKQRLAAIAAQERERKEYEAAAPARAAAAAAQKKRDEEEEESRSSSSSYSSYSSSDSSSSSSSSDSGFSSGGDSGYSGGGGGSSW
jgi:uncharacterized membrane protein YgcG